MAEANNKFAIVINDKSQTEAQTETERQSKHRSTLSAFQIQSVVWPEGARPAERYHRHLFSKPGDSNPNSSHQGSADRTAEKIRIPVCGTSLRFDSQACLPLTLYLSNGDLGQERLGAVVARARRGMWWIRYEIQSCEIPSSRKTDKTESYLSALTEPIHAPPRFILCRGYKGE